jgi:hypothetical protein
MGITINVINPYVKYSMVPVIPTGGACTNDEGCPNFTKTMPIEFLVTAVVTLTGEQCNNNNCIAYYDLDGTDWTQMTWDEFSKAWHEAPSSNSLGCDQYHNLNIMVNKTDGSATNTTSKRFFINCKEKLTTNPVETRITLGAKNIIVFNVTVWNPTNLSYDYELKMEKYGETPDLILSLLKFGQANSPINMTVSAVSFNSTLVNLTDAGRTGIYQIKFTAFNKVTVYNLESYGVIAISSQSLYEFSLLQLLILMLFAAIFVYEKKEYNNKRFHK